jgi:hypothetical protein
MGRKYLVNGSEIPAAVIQSSDNSPDRVGKISVKRLLNGDDGGPTVSFTSQAPGLLTQSHYHPIDQFQVMLEGEIDFEGELLKPMDIHYADARALYGPFSSGPAGATFAVLRQRKVGTVYMEKPGRTPALTDRQYVGIARDATWEESRNGVRKSVLFGADGKSPLAEILECEKGASIQTGTAPFGEFNLFFRGTFETEGKTLESYAIRYVEADTPTPSIRCLTDGGTIIVTRFDRPVLAPQVTA